MRANCVSPGGIVTELGANSARLEPGFTSPQAGDSAVPNPPAADSSSGPKPAPVPRLRRPGRAEDVAAAILFLASDEAAHISGQNLIVDGISTSHVA